MTAAAASGSDWARYLGDARFISDVVPLHGVEAAAEQIGAFGRLPPACNRS